MGSPRGIDRNGGLALRDSIAGAVGATLRRARRARGLTLQEVGARSGGEFTPTAVAGYERGERRISLQRFCDLATFYGVAPEELLAEVLRPEPPSELIDLTEVETPSDA